MSPGSSAFCTTKLSGKAKKVHSHNPDGHADPDGDKERLCNYLQHQKNIMRYERLPDTDCQTPDRWDLAVMYP